MHILLNTYLGIGRNAASNAIMSIRNGAEVFPETADSFGSIEVHSRTTYTDLNLKTRPQTGSGLKNTANHLTLEGSVKIPFLTRGYSALNVVLFYGGFYFFLVFFEILLLEMSF